LDNQHRQQKRTKEKLKALGAEKLTVILTDYFKSPSRDPLLSMNMCISVEMYLESFDAEQEQEEALSFLDMLNQENIDQPNILNLDSNQIATMDQHVWNGELTEWLDGLIAEMDEQSQLESFENNVDFENLIEDMIPNDWENVGNDVVNNFDSNLL